MTWNTALTEGSNPKDVIEYVKSFLNQDNSIAVLQQIPYKDPDNNWEISSTYNDFKEAFSDEKYTTKQNTDYNNGSITMMTVVVTRMKNVSEIKKLTNREHLVQIGDLYTLYGLHLHPKKADNKQELLALNDIDADIILGDFNAGDYNVDDDEECQNRKVFCSILKDYVNLCNLPTREERRKTVKGEKLVRKTCIDHVFVRRKFVTKCSELIVHEDIKISDHYPITFCIDNPSGDM